jgi:hypothetical protein
MEDVMGRFLLCAAMGALIASPAMAGGPAAREQAQDVAAQEAKAPTKSRVLYICDASDITRRAFIRQHGVMEFVTAEAAARPQDSWSAPRCISRSEYQRLQQKVSFAGR